MDRCSRGRRGRRQRRGGRFMMATTTRSTCSTDSRPLRGLARAKGFDPDQFQFSLFSIPTGSDRSRRRRGCPRVETTRTRRPVRATSFSPLADSHQPRGRPDGWADARSPEGECCRPPAFGGDCPPRGGVPCSHRSSYVSPWSVSSTNSSSTVGSSAESRLVYLDYYHRELLEIGNVWLPELRSFVSANRLP